MESEIYGQYRLGSSGVVKHPSLSISCLFNSQGRQNSTDGQKEAGNDGLYE